MDLQTTSLFFAIFLMFHEIFHGNSIGPVFRILVRIPLAKLDMLGGLPVPQTAPTRCARGNNKKPNSCRESGQMQDLGSGRSGGGGHPCCKFGDKMDLQIPQIQNRKQEPSRGQYETHFNYQDLLESMTNGVSAV